MYQGHLASMPLQSLDARRIRSAVKRQRSWLSEGGRFGVRHFPPLWFFATPILLIKGTTKAAESAALQISGFRSDFMLRAFVCVTAKWLISIAILAALDAQGTMRTADAQEAGALERLNNWHHWRGPDANGTAPKADPPITWNDQTNIQWKAALPGRGSATPIVWGDQAFIVTAIKTNRVADPANLPKADPTLIRKTEAPTHYYQFVVLAFDRRTGKLRWKQTAAEKVPGSTIKGQH